MPQDQLTQEQKIFMGHLLRSFDFSKLAAIFSDHLQETIQSLIPEKNNAVKWTREFLEKISQTRNWEEENSVNNWRNCILKKNPMAMMPCYTALKQRMIILTRF